MVFILECSGLVGMDFVVVLIYMSSNEAETKIH